MKKINTDFSEATKQFFNKYLKEIKGVSLNTIYSYRDSIKLLCLFIARDTNNVINLQVEDFSRTRIIDFLEYTEHECNNSISTRNIRLAAIHSFFKYLANLFPEYLNQCQQIINIPFKKSFYKETEYFEFEEIKMLLKCIDLRSWIGKRDYALILLMFNTGARAQEIVDMSISSLHLSQPYIVKFTGKGRKERTLPLWSSTVFALKRYLADPKRIYASDNILFINNQGVALTRFGVRYILKKRILAASSSMPSLENKNLHPHSMRHSTGVYLLKSGNDISAVANWLGHSSIDITNRYAVMDIEMKKQTLEKMIPPTNSEKRSWPKQDIIEWLKKI